MHFLQKAATFMNKLAVAVKRGDEAELLCKMVAEINVREEYVLQEDEDGCAVQLLFNLLQQRGTWLKQN